MLQPNSDFLKLSRCLRLGRRHLSAASPDCVVESNLEDLPVEHYVSLCNAVGVATNGRIRMTFAAISQHLRILEEAELVSARRDCRYRLHRLQPEPLRDVIHWSSEFEVFFDQRVDALGEYLDRKHARRR
jgi:DNA-binding transcriptional ArsR family regulator